MNTEYVQPSMTFIAFGDDIVSTSHPGDSCYADYQTNTWDEIDEGTCEYFSATYTTGFLG